jgi:hypothetical protein
MSDLIPPMMPDDLDALIQAMERVQQLEAELAKLRLTDEERDALEWAEDASNTRRAAAIRGLLKRMPMSESPDEARKRESELLKRYGVDGPFGPK